MTEDPISPERVAEALWQTILGIDWKGTSSHIAWIELPAAEKQQWRTRAEIAIADWKRSQGG
jgi:hypothetical protein